MYALYRELHGRMILEEDGFSSPAEATQWLKDNVMHDPQKPDPQELGRWEMREQEPLSVAHLAAPPEMTSSDIEYWFDRAKALLPGHIVSLA